MAYNPFDDVILDDPAYMANGGDTQPYRAGQAYKDRITKPAVQEDIARQSELMKSITLEPVNLVGDIFANTLGVIAENLVNQEEADRGREKFETRKEAAKMFNVVPQQLTPDQIRFYEQRTGKDVQRQTFKEGFNQTFDTLLRDAIDGSKAIREGANFTELPGAQQFGVGILPLEFYFGGLGGKQAIKGINEFRKQHGGKQIAEVLNDSKIAADFPEVIADMKAKFPMLDIGRDVTGARTTERFTDQDLVQSQMRAAEERGMRFKTGMPEEIRKPTYEILPGAGKGKGLVKKQEAIDDKVINIIKENPEGIAQKGSKAAQKEFKFDIKSYKKSLDRIEAANPDVDLTNFKFAEDKGRQITKAKLAEQDAANLEKIKNATSLKEAAELTGTSVKAMRGLVDRTDGTMQGGRLAEQLGIGRVEKESARRKDVLDNFLEQNKNQEFTRPELARRTGVPLEFVKDKRAFQTTKPNLVEYQNIKNKEFDERISEMNRLLDDISTGKIQGRRGPKYYKEQGYDAFTAGQINSHPSYLAYPTQGEKLKLKVKPENLSNIIGQKNRPPGEIIDHITNFVNLDIGPSSTLKNRAKIALREYFRSLSDVNRKELTKIISDPELFGFIPKSTLDESGKVIPNENWDELTQKRNLDNLYNTILSLTDPADIMKLGQAQDLKRAINTYADKKFFDALDGSPALQKQFIDEVNRVLPKNKYGNDWKKAYKQFKNRFHGQISHEFSQKTLGTLKNRFSLAPGMEGKFGDPASFRINFDNHNVGLQPIIENGTKLTVAKMNKAKNVGDQTVELAKIIDNDVELKKRGMLAYIRFSDRQMSDASFNFLKRNLAPNQVFMTSKGFGKTPKGIKTLILGDPKKPDFDGLKSYLDEKIDKMVADPKSFKLDKRKPTGANQDDMIESGDNKSIRLGFINKETFKDGGPVRMAIGGDPLENINQQQFAPDPAFEGKDFFQEAVDSGNLTAFNPLKLFKVFGKVDAVETPKKKIQTDTQQAPPGTTLPAKQDMQPSDFALKSFTLETIMDPNAPKAARPQDWQNFFKGKAAPEAELRDSGILQYLGDFSKYFPDQKITQQQLVDFYETSPMGNISIKVKEAPTGKDAGYENFVGRPRHQEAGQQPLDEVGTDYREVVVQAGPLPSQEKAFVASGHFSEENVIGFTRVANYNNTSGQQVAVIQELQTDMLTQVRKEQERLNALLKRIENVKAKAQERIGGTDEYYRAMGQRQLDAINQQFPPATLQKLQENLSAIKPFPNTAGAELIPTYSKELSDLQKEINKLAEIDITSPNPQTIFGIDAIETQQQKVLDNLLDLTRDSELERDLKGIQVPSTRESDDLVAFGQSADDMNLQYGGFKDLELFPPIPFNKQPDYVDLLIKATIKDAQTKGINKVAIMPAEKVNRRWGKDPNEPEGKKFKNLYDQVAVQQLKNIAKKYKGNVAIEQIVDNTKPSKALRFFNRDVDGGLKLNKEDVARRTTSESEEGLDEFYTEQIRRFVSGGGYRDKDVVLTREVAPGQFQDFFVRADDDSVNLVPLGEGDIINDALIVIEEFNPQLVDMVTLTLDSPQSKGPLFMFKKKDGGTIAKDSLVSLTDIFGQYGR